MDISLDWWLEHPIYSLLSSNNQNCPNSISRAAFDQSTSNAENGVPQTEQSIFTIRWLSSITQNDVNSPLVMKFWSNNYFGVNNFRVLSCDLF